MNKIVAIVIYYVAAFIASTNAMYSILNHETFLLKIFMVINIIIFALLMFLGYLFYMSITKSSNDGDVR